VWQLVETSTSPLGTAGLDSCKAAAAQPHRGAGACRCVARGLRSVCGLALDAERGPAVFGIPTARGP
jgi:hypothetical protein